MNRRNLFKTAGTVILSTLFPGIAAAASWVALGRRRAQASNSGGIVRFPVNADQFLHFRLSVSGGATKIETIEIHLSNGRRRVANLNQLVQSGGSSPSINLGEGNRSVRFVVVRYGKYQDGRGGTYIHLWGKS